MATTVTAAEIVQVQDWPAVYTDSIARVMSLLERHGEGETLRIIAAVLDARGSQFAAGHVQRAVARIEQGA